MFSPGGAMLGHVVALPLRGRPPGLRLSGLFPRPLLWLDLCRLLPMLLLGPGILLPLPLPPVPLLGLLGCWPGRFGLPLGPDCRGLGPLFRALRPRLGFLVGGIRLLPFGPGFLLRVRTPRLLFALVMLRIGRRHGLEQQRQDAHVDKSKCLHGAYLLWPVLVRQ
jgi:hypothetical protein